MTTTDPSFPSSTDKRIEDLAGEARALRSRADRRDWLIGILSIFVLGLIVLVGVLAGRLNDVDSVVKDLHATAQGNHHLQTEIDQNTNTIKDCTQPDGACFKAGQARTEQLVNGAVVGIGTAVHDEACKLLQALQASGSLTASGAAAAKASEHC